MIDKKGEERIVILYVDDEQNNLISFKATFRIKYKVLTAISAEEAMRVLENNKVEIIVTDQKMPNITGVEFLEKVIEQYPEPMRIMLTGFADMGAMIDAVNKGKIFHYLNKPWKEEELEETFIRAHKAYLEQVQVKEKNKHLEMTNEQLEFLLRQKLLS